MVSMKLSHSIELSAWHRKYLRHERDKIEAFFSP